MAGVSLTQLNFQEIIYWLKPLLENYSPIPESKFIVTKVDNEEDIAIEFDNTHSSIIYYYTIENESLESISNEKFIINSFNFKQGTLIVDAWDRERQELVWRGIATAAVSSNPDKNDKKIEKALKKIMKKWDEAKGYRVRAIRQMKAEEAEQ